MMTKKLLVALVVMALVGLANAETVMLITNGAPAGVVDTVGTTYPTGLPGDIIPAGMEGVYNASTYRIEDATAPMQDGSGVQYQIHPGASWPNAQGVEWTGGPILTGSYTIEMLINPDYTHGQAQTGEWGISFGTTWRSVLMSTEEGWETGEMVMWIDQTTGKVTFQPQSGSTFGDITSSIALQEGDTKLGGPWYHLAVVVDRALGTTEMFINGNSAGTGIIPNNPDDVDIKLSLEAICVGGPLNQYPQCNFQGMMDAFAISDVALAPANFVLPIVPEPATITLLTVGLGMIIRRKRS
ncbi:MAG: hypothetical protein A2Y12_06820 [Planctomycetes bacterium GWF2_42_9]|nr:MAG: hypothetical protein A2Y12_06820 [Planctomycetes bacterium GWF2_42_9]